MTINSSFFFSFFFALLICTFHFVVKSIQIHANSPFKNAPNFNFVDTKFGSQEFALVFSTPNSYNLIDHFENSFESRDTKRSRTDRFTQFPTTDLRISSMAKLKRWLQVEEMNGQEIKRNKKRVFRCSLFLFERYSYKCWCAGRVNDRLEWYVGVKCALSYFSRRIEWTNRRENLRDFFCRWAQWAPLSRDIRQWHHLLSSPADMQHSMSHQLPINHQLLTLFGQF